MSGFLVQTKPCSTCIYRKDTFFDIKLLEGQITDARGNFVNYRICHHSDSACCSGFWKRHKDDFQMGQIAQRLGLVQMVKHDTLKGS